MKVRETFLNWKGWNLFWCTRHSAYNASPFNTLKVIRKATILAALWFLFWITFVITTLLYWSLWQKNPIPFQKMFIFCPYVIKCVQVRGYWAFFLLYCRKEHHVDVVRTPLVCGIGNTWRYSWRTSMKAKWLSEREGKPADKAICSRDVADTFVRPQRHSKILGRNQRYFPGVLILPKLIKALKSLEFKWDCSEYPKISIRFP